MTDDTCNTHHFPCKGGNHKLTFCPECKDVYCSQCGTVWYEVGPDEEPVKENS